MYWVYCCVHCVMFLCCERCRCVWHGHLWQHTACVQQNAVHVMLANVRYLLHVTAAMLREMHLLCVDRRMTIHMYVVRKTVICWSVTRPPYLHSNTVCVWDYRWYIITGTLLVDFFCDASRGTKVRHKHSWIENKLLFKPLLRTYFLRLLVFDLLFVENVSNHARLTHWQNWINTVQRYKV